MSALEHVNFITKKFAKTAYNLNKKHIITLDPVCKRQILYISFEENNNNLRGIK